MKSGGKNVLNVIHFVDFEDWERRNIIFELFIKSDYQFAFFEKYELKIMIASKLFWFLEIN